MTNKQKQEAFTKHVDAWIDDPHDETPILTVALGWIKKNLSPDEVFNRKELLHWLEENKDNLENKYPSHEQC